MSILTIQNLELSFGARDVFSGISARLPNDAKVGLVGPNGIGKTSLLRILAGTSTPTAGSVHMARGVQIGYLRQEAVEAFAGHEHSVRDEMLTVFAPLQAQAASLRAMEAQMAAGETGEELLTTYGTTQHDFEEAGGYDYEMRIRRVLEGLGFPEDTWGTPMGHLSGGQKTRALLARLLLERPTLLIMDEPTNHLDVQAIEWLETTLRGWKGALLIASHDRFFLDRVVDYIWELTPQHIESYRGNYSAYVHQREERWERNTQIVQTEIERLESELEVIVRYLAWRKITEAKSRLQRLGRDLVAIERYGILGVQGKSWSELGLRTPHIMSVDEVRTKIKAIRPLSTRPPRVHMRLKTSGRSGQIVLRTEGLQVGYDGVALFAPVDLRLDRLDRVALIGPNGAGKTTFLRTVLGDLPPVAGKVELGSSLSVGYFAQAHDGLNPENTVLDELLRQREMSPGEARSYLAQYLFRGEDVWKPVRALSGGERGRLALAILTAQGVNLLLLDEPTNHLDIPAQEVLQEALEYFDGTVIMVSHDRYLVSQIATEIWELRDGALHIFPGTYAEMIEQRERATAPPVVPVERTETPAERPVSDEKQERRRVRMLATLETQIAEAEAMLAEYTRRLQEDGEAGNLAELSRLSDEYRSTEERLDHLLSEWSAIQS